MNKTSISWTQSDDGLEGATWNPTDGCEVCSPGCANCYAMRMAGRFSGPGLPYEGLVTIGKSKRAIWNGEGQLNEKALARPLHWRAPRRVFVNSMSDLFFRRFSNDDIASVFGVMAETQRHTYQILTKRGERMREWYEWRAGGMAEDDDVTVQCVNILDDEHPGILDHRVATAPPPWPLPNVWIGVSVEDQKHGLPRIDELREVPAAVRFLSVEPLLEDLGRIDLRGIHWVIAGCESGPGARTCEIDWLRSVRDQAADAGVPFFLKQAVRSHDEEGAADGLVGIGPGSRGKSWIGKRRGKGAGGQVVELPYLDGVQHRAFPIARAA